MITILKMLSQLKHLSFGRAYFPLLGPVRFCLQLDYLHIVSRNPFEMHPINLVASKLCGLWKHQWIFANLKSPTSIIIVTIIINYFFVHIFLLFPWKNPLISYSHKDKDENRCLPILCLIYFLIKLFLKSRWDSASAFSSLIIAMHVDTTTVLQIVTFKFDLFIN